MKISSYSCSFNRFPQTWNFIGKNRLETRSHVVSLEEVTRSSPEVEKAVFWYKVILEIAQEVEMSFPEVVKSYLLGRRLFLKVRIYIIGAVDSCGKSKLSS